jgi:hypothetical protein
LLAPVEERQTLASEIATNAAQVRRSEGTGQETGRAASTKLLDPTIDIEKARIDLANPPISFQRFRMASQRFKGLSKEKEHMQVFLGRKDRRIKCFLKGRSGFGMATERTEAEGHLRVRLPCVVRVVNYLLKIGESSVIHLRLPQHPPSLIQIPRRHSCVHAQTSVLVAEETMPHSGAKIRP